MRLRHDTKRRCQPSRRASRLRKIDVAPRYYDAVRHDAPRRRDVARDLFAAAPRREAFCHAFFPARRAMLTRFLLRDAAASRCRLMSRYDAV